MPVFDIQAVFHPPQNTPFKVSLFCDEAFCDNQDVINEIEQFQKISAATYQKKCQIMSLIFCPGIKKTC